MSDAKHWLIGSVRVLASLRYVSGQWGQADFELTARGKKNATALQLAWREAINFKNGPVTLRPASDNNGFEVMPIEIKTTAKCGKAQMRCVPLGKVPA